MIRLYSGTSAQFLQDTTRNQIAEKLRRSFIDQFRYQPQPNEVQSWRNSLRAMSLTLQHAGLTDHGIILEYQLPLTSLRLDCMILGRNRSNQANAVVVELKQWERCGEAPGANEVVTWVGGGAREVLHPSVQVGQYQTYLQDSHTAFHEGDSPVGLSSCAYLHNYAYAPDDVIFAPKFEEAVRLFPLYTADQVDALAEFLDFNLSEGNGLEVLQRVEESRYRPSKKLMVHVGGVIQGRKEFVLLDEQLVVHDKVVALAKEGFHDRRKHTLIVKGGPGTGKSVIAINLMAELLLNGYNAHYATGSKAFTETLRHIIGRRGSVQFNFFNSFGQVEPNQIDVLISDEAHRIRATSTDRFTPRDRRSGLSQVEELIRAAKVNVFLLDDLQSVRPFEIGSVEYIRSAAEEAGSIIHEYALEAQFRCSGSEAFVNWVDNTLGIRRTANIIWDQQEEFEFRVFPSPEALEKAIQEKAIEGYSARITAGFCWPWSKPNPDGTLVDDVTIGDFRRPWNARPDARRLAPGIPKAPLWAHDSTGINQIGCVYTAQGFEFDSVGVIFGSDLTYDLDSQTWVGHREESHDRVVARAKGEEFLRLVRNTYRVLLTRGMKGCYVYFTDKDTERFFKSRLEQRP